LGDIKSSVQDALKSAISDAISGSANKALKTLPTIEPISSDPPIEIDYELIGDPVTKSNAFIALPGLGEFYDTKSPSESPYSPSSLPIEPTSEMVQLIIADYVFESAGYVLFSEDQLRLGISLLLSFRSLYYMYSSNTIDVTPSDIPKSSPLSLNTSSFARKCFDFDTMVTNAIQLLFLNYTMNIPTMIWNFILKQQHLLHSLLLVMVREKDVLLFSLMSYTVNRLCLRDK